MRIILKRLSVLLAGMLFIATAGVLAGIRFNDSVDTGASSDDVISYDISSVKRYLKDSYDNITDLKENASYILTYNGNYVKNYSQTILNDYYNNRDGVDSNDVTGTCTIVATLGMVNYYGNIRKEGTYGYSDGDTFVKIMDGCLDEGYTTRRSGTSKSKVNNCLSEAFDQYSISRGGNTEWYYLESKIRDFVDSKHPVIFDVSNHSTVAVGYTSYTFKYTETYTTGTLWWKKTKTRTSSTTKKFIIVNEGWGYRNAGSLIDCDKIGNITDSMQICYAEKD